MRILAFLPWLVLGNLALAQLPIVLENDAESSGWHERSLVHEGLTRWYLVYRPMGLPENAPVVFLFHGGRGSMRRNFDWGSSMEWPYLAEQEKFVLVVPNGVNLESNDTYGDSQNWNDLRPSEAGEADGADDVGFLRKVIDEVVAGELANPLRVYFTGTSNGGLMSFRMAMEMGGRVAAIGTFVANMPVDNESFQPLQRRVPVLMCNGDLDPLMPWEGEPGVLRSAAETVAWWVEKNGANSVPQREFYYEDLRSDDLCRVYRTDYGATLGGAPVSFLKVEGGGHNSPSIARYGTAPRFLQNLVGPQNGDVESVDLLWEFFQDHEVPLRPKLVIEEVELLESGREVQLRFEGGYPGGTIFVEGSDELGEDAEWILMAESPAGDLGELESRDLLLPEETFFLRGRAVPLGR